MQRYLSLLLSFVTVAMLFTATAAQASATTYRAQLVEATQERTPIIRRAAWVCDGDSCTTDQARSRPAYVCISVARELGRVASFSVNGEAIADEELARCNAEAQ